MAAGGGAGGAAGVAAEDIAGDMDDIDDPPQALKAAITIVQAAADNHRRRVVERILGCANRCMEVLPVGRYGSEYSVSTARLRPSPSTNAGKSPDNQSAVVARSRLRWSRVIGPHRNSVVAPPRYCRICVLRRDRSTYFCNLIIGAS